MECDDRKANNFVTKCCKKLVNEARHSNGIQFFDLVVITFSVNLDTSATTDLADTKIKLNSHKSSGVNS